MHTTEHTFSFEIYDSPDELSNEDLELFNEAKNFTRHAYAPYSHFQVGAAAKLVNDRIVHGTNQENASYPLGLCAERVLLASVSSLHPNVAIKTLAISYHNLNGKSDHPVTPCGICRQALQEFEDRASQPIRLILGGMHGKVYVFPKASLLLPLAFTSGELK